MSRRKQPKPQYVHVHAHLYDHPMEDIPNPTCEVHICEQCCAEFSDITDLHQHQTECSKEQLVLIVSENESPASTPSTLTLTSSLFNTEEQVNGVTCTDDAEEFCDFSKDETSEGTNESLHIFDSSCDDKKSHLLYDNRDSDKADGFNSAFSSALPQEESLLELCKLSVINSNVFIENLENTKVAVAQFSQETCLSPHISSRTTSNGKMAAPGVIGQLIALQEQQVQQLKLIEEIQHRIMLLAAQNSDTPVAINTCNGPSQTSSLIKLSSHLSEQLAAAAGLAENLANHSGIVGYAKESQNVTQTNQDGTRSDKGQSQLTDKNSGTLTLTLTSKDGSDLCSVQSLQDRTVSNKADCINHLKVPSPSPPSKTDLNKLQLSYKPNGINICVNALPSIGAIVEDLNALTALAQQRKSKPLNVTLYEQKKPSDDCIFKHKCRFCAKVFGSDSALQIHLRSHTGERPYKCNICGNRFSTRGNLKVHFQRHKEKYPNIQMNPYPVPEHLDNVPTSTGIPYGMSLPPERPVPSWLNNKSLVGNNITSLPSLPPFIKKEEQGVSITKPPSPVVSEVYERSNGHDEGFSSSPSLISSEKFQKVTQALSVATFVSSSGEGAGDHITTNASVNKNLITQLKLEQLETKFLFESLPDHPGASETTKLEQLVENIDKKSSDPNECVICHRVLSCQSALKMHYRTHTGERPFKCRVCGRAFTTKGNLKTHYSIHRSTPLLKIQHSCPICQEKFTNAMVLQQHIHMHMGGHIPNVPLHESYPEPMNQDSDFVEGRNLEVENFSNRNMEVIEGVSDSIYPDSLSDSQCSSPVPSVSESQMTASHGDDLSDSRLKTMENGLIDEDLTLRSSALNGDHKSPSWNPSSQNGSALETHRYATTDRHQKFSSAVPSSSSLSHPNLTVSGLLDATSGDILKDSHDFAFRERGTLKSNICDICNKTFACQSALDIHYRSHTKERPFICTVCSRGFSTKGNLKQHMLTHQMRDLPSQLFEPANQILILPPNQFLPTMDPIIPSNQMKYNGFPKTDPQDSSGVTVGSSASMLSTLSTPILTAAPLRRTAKQHFCHTCGKTFSSSSALQIHERTHTGEKPFACNICGRAFTTKGNLKVHMGTHMWSSSPARRGRRLSVDGPILRSNPERFPDTPPKDVVARVTNGDTIGHWSHYGTVTSGLGVRTNEIPVIQNGGLSRLSFSPGHLESLEKLRQTELNRAFPWLERLSENGTMFHFRPLVEDNKITATD